MDSERHQAVPWAQSSGRAVPPWRHMGRAHSPQARWMVGGAARLLLFCGLRRRDVTGLLTSRCGASLL